MIEIRQPCIDLAEFEDAVRLQQAIWGFADIELLPVRFFVVANKVGGQVFGAYDGGRMVGFCFAIPGIKPGGSRTCTATCWACCRSTATAASAGGSSCGSARKRWRAAST